MPSPIVKYYLGLAHYLGSPHRDLKLELFAAVVDTLPPRYRELLGLAPPRAATFRRDAMRTDGPVLGERAPSKVAALFGDQRGAEAAAARLRRELGLGEAQVRVLSPGDPHPGRKIEPDDRGIWRTAIKSHVTLGLLGLMAVRLGHDSRVLRQTGRFRMVEVVGCSHRLGQVRQVAVVRVVVEHGDVLGPEPLDDAAQHGGFPRARAARDADDDWTHPQPRRTYVTSVVRVASSCSVDSSSSL